MIDTAQPSPTNAKGDNTASTNRKTIPYTPDEKVSTLLKQLPWTHTRAVMQYHYSLPLPSSCDSLLKGHSR